MPAVQNRYFYIDPSRCIGCNSCVLIYTFFSAVTITEPKPSIEVALNGSWLLVTVATESLSILGTLV
ncbi:MAG: 4Fe-4S binding protein, partial [Verrucomicrobia bacterium]|nr:4Fe-4S binding protein [Verrucomicrobiota bacterium]